MGKRGPPKSPVSKLKARGTYRRDRHSDDIDKRLVPALPAAPAHFDSAAKKTWQRIGQTFAKHGLLTELDALAFELLVTSYQSVLDTAKQLGREELVYFVGESGAPVPNPLVGINAKSVATLKWALTQFGATPAARTGIKISNSKPETLDPMQELLSRKQ